MSLQVNTPSHTGYIHNSEAKINRMGQLYSIIEILLFEYRHAVCLLSDPCQLWQDYYHMSVAVVIYCCGSVVVMCQFVLGKYTTV